MRTHLRASCDSTGVYCNFIHVGRASGADSCVDQWFEDLRTEEPVVVPGQETLKSEIPAEPVPVSGTVNAPVKVDTEKVTGEVKPGAAAENTKITETVEEKKPEEAK